jgi:hypothetical protein
MLAAEAERKLAGCRDAADNFLDGAVVGLLVGGHHDVAPVMGRDVAQVKAELVEPRLEVVTVETNRLGAVGGALAETGGAIERVAPDYETRVVESRFSVGKKLRHA